MIGYCIGNTFYAVFRAKGHYFFLSAGLEGLIGLSLDCGDLDFDPHAGIGQASRDHGGGGADLSEVTAQDRPTGLEVLEFREDVTDPHNILNAASGLGQRVGDVPEALLRLLDYIGGDGHSPIVEAGCAGHEHQTSIDDCARVADVPFERRAGRD
jgi:hypothetical protein